jgi:integrase
MQLELCVRPGARGVAWCSKLGGMAGLRFRMPTSAKSRRTIPLTPGLVAILRTWKARQNEGRLLLGSAYRDYGLVFALPDSGPINKDNLCNQTFTCLVKFVRLIRIHDPRHCYASRVLPAGVPLKTVAELFGKAKARQCSPGLFRYPRQDSNPQPCGPKPHALSS